MYAVLTFTIFLVTFVCYFNIVSSKVIYNEESSKETFSNQPNLLMAHTIIRHGDRNLYYTCPTDPWKDPKFWPEGFGQLTNIGKRQEFELGELLAKRYQSLIPNGYSAETVKVYSSEYARTMMSAAACLAGLFPPTKQQIWNPNLLWHPIPINMIAGSIDTKIHTSLNKCKLLNELYNEYINSAEVQEFFKSYEKTLDYVTTNCGESVDVAKIYDSLNVEMIRNLTIPAWVTKEVFDDLEKLTLFWFKTYTTSPQLSKLKIGFLIKEIFNDFINKSQGSEKKTFVMHSGHDTTLVNILNSLGVFDDVLPSYAACVVFELYEENDDFYVQIVYKNGNELRVLDIPECGTKCPLRNFIDKYQAILPQNDYDTECQNKQ